MARRWAYGFCALALAAGMTLACGCQRSSGDVASSSQSTDASTQVLSGSNASASDEGSSSSQQEQEAAEGNFFSFADNKEIASFSKKFKAKKYAAIEFAHTNDDGTTRARFTDASTIETVYEALKRINVGDATTKRVTNDTSKFTFVTAKGHGLTFEFEGEYYRYGDVDYKLSDNDYLMVLKESFTAAAR